MLESSKYNIIWKSTSIPNIITSDDCEYATFLKDLERVCSKTGYLDSKFYTKNVNLRSPLTESVKSARQSVVHSFDVAKDREKFIDEYEKRMKRINASLLQEKKQERVLKRHEGDIIKKQHLINQSLRSYESDINEKKFQQDLKLSETAENLEKIRKRYYFEKSITTKERMRLAINNHVEKIGKSRKMDLHVSKLLREFNAKKNELDSNSNNISRLMENFEKNLAQEENKHKQLQKELQSISEALKLKIASSQTQKLEMESENMKLVDHKIVEDKNKEFSLDQFLNQSDGGIKVSETERKILDAKLALKKEEDFVKMKENSGALNNIRNKLTESENTQRKLISDTEYINLMMKRVDKQNKIESANLRRIMQKETFTNSIIKAREENESNYDDRMYKRQILTELENETDNMSHLKGVLKQGKENEQKLFKKMNDASKEIKEESMVTNRLSKELHDMQVVNSSRINEDMRQANKHEQELEEELNRQRTKIIELQSKRNYYFNELVSCRKYLQENKYLLGKSESFTSRLETIKEKGNQNQSNLPKIV